MKSLEAAASRGEGRLWVIALGLSMLVNAGILVIMGFALLKSQIYQKNHPLPESAPAVTTVTIVPALLIVPSAAETPPPTQGKPSFVRTSEDQASPPPEKTALIGERDTQATSDRAAVVTAPPLPSQAGIEPRNKEDFETTQSDYQDGDIAGNHAAKPPDLPAPSLSETAHYPALANQPSTGKITESPGNDLIPSSPPAAEHLMTSPDPVDVPVPRELAEKNEIKPSPPRLPESGSPAPKPVDVPKPKVTQPVDDPAFRGYQRKTAITGSISRSGRSALDVADSPLGRYQAIISRAVELEWQRNCVRHRDFITPGFLTVRFFVETSGKVRTVQFVGDMETGEVQKGFTLNSIRDAEIPAMPPTVKKDFAKEPLELIFNFYF